jgi:ATP phosphoribosyltransferase
MEKVIKFGLPKGSLNTPGRGNTESIFLNAGYDIKGYTPTKESNRSMKIANDPEISLFLSRPQSSPSELLRELLDVAIIGEDWVRETQGEEGQIERLCDLEYGQTKLIVALPKENPAQNLNDYLETRLKDSRPLICYSEYVNLTRTFIASLPAYKKKFGDAMPLLQIRGITVGDNDKVVVINSDGVTEGYIEKGADIVVDNTQTGSTLKAYGLKILDTIMTSTSGLYAGPSINRDPWLREKASAIAEALNGVVTARKYNDVKFNIPKNKLDTLIEYLKSNSLFVDSPTINDAGEYYAVNIVVPRAIWPRISNELKSKHGASGISRVGIKQLIL